MPRSIQINLSNAAADHNPTDTLFFDPTSLTKTVQQYTAQSNDGTAYINDFVGSILTVIDDLTGLNLTSWATELENLQTSNSGTGDVLSWYTNWSSGWDSDISAIINAFAPGGTAAEFDTGVSNLLQLFGLTSSSVGGATSVNAIWQAVITDIINPLNAIETEASNIVGTIEQQAVAGLTALETGVQNTWDSLFGSTSAPSSAAKVSSTSVASSQGNSSLQADWNSTIANLQNTWNSLFGSTAAPSSTAKVSATSVSSSTGGSSLQSDWNTTITNLQNTWSSLFGSTSAPSNSAQVQQSSVNGLAALWNNIFGTTTPTSSTPIQQSAVANLGNAWTALFGNSSAPTTASTVTSTALPTNVQSANTYWTTLMSNLFGSSTPSATVQSSALPAISVGGSSGTISAQIQSVVDSIYQAFNGGSSTGNTTASVKTNLQSLFTNLFGTTTAGTQIQQSSINGLQSLWNGIFGTTTPSASSKVSATSVASSTGGSSLQADWTTATTNLQNTWTSLFGSSSAPSSSAQVQQSAINGLQTLWNGIFGTTTPTASSKISASSVTSSTGASSLQADWSAVTTNLQNTWNSLFGSTSAPSSSALVQQSAVANLSNAWTALFGSSAAPTTSSQVQQSSINGLTSIWNVLFGTTTPGTSSKVQAASVTNVLGGANLGADLAALTNTIGGALGLGSSGNTPSAISTPLANAVGSSMFRAYCSSTTQQQLAGNGTNAFPVTLNGSSYITSDYSFSSSTNTLTVSIPGLYIVKVGIANSGSITGTYVIAPLLYRNGSVARYGAGQCFPHWSGSPGGVSTWLADSFTIECNAGDTLSPGVYMSAGYGQWYFFGDSTGAETYFEVSLVRAT